MNVHKNVGVLDMSAFAKMEVSGPGARAWLESIFANAIPKKRGRIALCHMLTVHGGVRAEFTVYEWAPGRFYLVSAGAYEAHDHDYLRKLAPTDGSVRLQQITQRLGVLVLAGPKSRDVLKKLTRTSLENKDFPWLSGKEISVGAATAHALRVNFVGELGWELHHPIEMQNYIFDKLMEAGAEFGIKPFGIRAMLSMSVEKSYRLIPREMSIEYNAYESALDRFIKPEKEFLGRDGSACLQGKGPEVELRDAGCRGRQRCRRPRLGSHLQRGRRARRPRDERHLRLPHQPLAGACHAAAGLCQGRHEAEDQDPRHDV